MGPVQALGFGQLVEADVDEGDVCARGQVAGLGQERVGGAAVASVSGGVALQDEASGARPASSQEVVGAVEARGIDLRGTRSLVSGGLGHVADEGNPSRRSQRKQAPLVAQERDGLGGDARGELVVSVFVVGPTVGLLCSSEGHVHDLLGASVDVGLVEASLGDGRDDLARTVQAGSGHLEAASGAHRRDGVVGSSPVGDDQAVKAPLRAQDIRQQVRVLVGVRAVDEVVGAHDGARVGTAAHNFEGGEVDFAHRTFVDDRVRGHAAQLLGVDGEVLGACRGSRGLYSLHEGRSHGSGEKGVLGEVLEVASTQG